MSVHILFGLHTNIQSFKKFWQVWLANEHNWYCMKCGFHADWLLLFVCIVIGDVSIYPFFVHGRSSQAALIAQTYILKLFSFRHGFFEIEQSRGSWTSTMDKHFFGAFSLTLPKQTQSVFSIDVITYSSFYLFSVYRWYSGRSTVVSRLSRPRFEWGKSSIAFLYFQWTGGVLPYLMIFLRSTTFDVGKSRWRNKVHEQDLFECFSCKPPKPCSLVP